MNRSRIATVVCVLLTNNLRWAEAPGNVLLAAKVSGLPKHSVANTSQIVTLNCDVLVTRVTRFSLKRVEEILSGIDVILGR